jgi:hypothetical protein
MEYNFEKFIPIRRKLSLLTDKRKAYNRNYYFQVTKIKRKKKSLPQATKSLIHLSPHLI